MDNVLRISVLLLPPSSLGVSMVNHYELCVIFDFVLYFGVGTVKYIAKTGCRYLIATEFLANYDIRNIECKDRVPIIDTTETMVE